MKILFLGNKRKIRGYGKGYNGDIFITLFKDELARQHDVLFWGWGYQYNWQGDKNIWEILDFFGKPDVIMTLCVTDFNKIGLNEVTDILKVHFVGDFYPSMTEKEYKRHRYLYNTIGYDLYFSPNTIIRKYVEDEIIKGESLLWPWSVDTNFFKDYETERTIDNCFMGSSWEALYGKGRSEAKQIIKTMPGNNWTRRAYFDEYVDILNKSKIFVVNNFKLGYWPKKVLEAMSCGCMVLSDHYPEYDVYGFRNKTHLVIYEDFDEMKRLACFCRTRPSLIEKIAKAGSKFVRNKFNIIKAVESLTEILERRLK